MSSQSKVKYQLLTGLTLKKKIILMLPSNMLLNLDGKRLSSKGSVSKKRVKIRSYLSDYRYNTTISKTNIREGKKASRLFQIISYFIIYFSSTCVDKCYVQIFKFRDLPLTCAYAILLSVFFGNRSWTRRRKWLKLWTIVSGTSV